MKNEYRILNIGVLVLITTFHFLIFTIPAHAQSSATKPATQSASTAQKLDALKKEIASKAAQLKTEVSKKLENRMSLGAIQSIETNDKTNYQIIIKAQKGNQLIKSNEYTFLQNGLNKVKKSNLAYKDLEKADVIIALGDVDDKQNLNAKKIIRLDKYEPVIVSSYFGTVENITGNKITLKTKDGQKEVLVSNQTAYKLKGDEDGKQSDLKVQNKILVTGTENSSKQFLARFIFMPEAVAAKTPLPTMVASGSGKLKPSPTPKK